MAGQFADWSTISRPCPETAHVRCSPSHPGPQRMGSNRPSGNELGVWQRE
jgi:hypothetical protein